MSEPFSDPAVTETLKLRMVVELLALVAGVHVTFASTVPLFKNQHASFVYVLSKPVPYAAMVSDPPPVKLPTADTEVTVGPAVIANVAL